MTSISVSIRFAKGEGSNQSLHSLLGRYRPVRLSIFQRTRYPKAAFCPDMFSFSLSGHLQSFGRHTQRGFGFPVNNRVPFSHKHHVDALGIDCRYCHTSVEKSSLLEAVESPVRKSLSSLRTPIRLRRRNPFAADCRLSKADKSFSSH